MKAFGVDRADTLAQVLAPEDVHLDLAPRDKAEALMLLADLAGRRLGLDPAPILGRLAQREDLGSSGIGVGVALPHAVIDDLRAPLALFAILRAPVDFAAMDRVPVDVVFLLLSPPGQPGAHLRIMSAVARCCREAEGLARLRGATIPAEARDYLLHGAEDRA